MKRLNGSLGACAKGTKPTRLSPSSISLFLECPRCFWLKMNRKIKRPSGPFPSLPAGMDKVLKVHFDTHRKDDSAPEELEGKFEGRLFQDLEKLDVWRNNFRGLQYTDPKTGILLMGALDDLFVTKDGKYAPLDFKTRGYPRKEDTHEYYQHQMDIYSFLLEKNGMESADFAILIFYHPLSVNEDHHVVFNPDPIKVLVDRVRGEKIFLDAAKCLLGGEPKGKCEWCEGK
ncbi:MAG: PD-(D/E)XK nuclease family protein [Candidatus Aenigmarchaeota archaeon]|nr:PD-(D/E)XK nuclease family protein [Candidatus Aenigmarchaeota archaeon]